MSGFSFPPPPPPPPKSNTANGQNAPQRGDRSHARGRGERGNLPHRGSGQSGGRAHGGRNHYNYQQGRSQNVSTDAFQSQPLPVSPHLAANQMSYGPSLASQRPQSRNGQRSAGSPPRTAAGHKRKLDALRGSPQTKPEKKAAPATAPAVPGFGAPIFPVLAPAPKSKTPSSSNGQTTQKPPVRSLGLTPGAGEPQYSSSEGDNEEVDVDEEAMYAELGDKLTFEHNGVMMSLNSQADLLAWKQARRKNWPTNARMVTKDEERRKVGEERKRLLAGVDALYGTASPFPISGSNIWTNRYATDKDLSINAEALAASSFEAGEPATGLERAKNELSEKTKRLEELRRKVAESEARNRKLRERAEKSHSRQDDASALSPTVDSYQHTAETDTVVEQCVMDEGEGELSTVQMENDDASPESHSDTESDGSSEDSDDYAPSDEAPEESTSKPPVSEPMSTNDHRPMCRYFRASGWCRDGDACRFSHNIPNPSALDQQRRGERLDQLQKGRKQGHVRNDERQPRLEKGVKKEGPTKTIFQRLMEQEEEEDDRLALKVVKYLGQMDFFH